MSNELEYIFVIVRSRSFFILHPFLRLLRVAASVWKAYRRRRRTFTPVTSAATSLSLSSLCQLPFLPIYSEILINTSAE